MESDEQTELTCKIETDWLLDGEQDDSYGVGVRRWRGQAKGKRAHGLDNNVVIAGWGGEVGIRGLNGNGKNTIKILKTWCES